MGRQNKFDALAGLAMVGQFGITMVLPILLCTFFGVWLSERFALGSWVIIVSLCVGLVCAGCSFYQFARSMLARFAREDKQAEQPDEEHKEDSSHEN